MCTQWWRLETRIPTSRSLGSRADIQSGRTGSLWSSAAESLELGCACLRSNHGYLWIPVYYTDYCQVNHPLFLLHFNVTNLKQLRMRNLHQEPRRDSYHSQRLPNRLRIIGSFLHQSMGEPHVFQLDIWNDGFSTTLLVSFCLVAYVERT